MGISKRQIISGERAVSEKGGKEGRRTYLSNDITALEWKRYPFIAMFSLTGTFLGHRALLLHLLFALVSSPHHFSTEPSSVTSAESQGEEGGEDMEE